MTSPAIDSFSVAGTRVLCALDGRGNSTEAVRDFAKGDVVFKEQPLAMVYPSRDPPWLASLRRELKTLSEDCAWQYCVAVYCLTIAELPHPCAPGLRPIGDAERAKLMELCGSEEISDNSEPSQLASVAANHLLKAAEAEAGDVPVCWPAEVGMDGDAGICKQREQATEWLAYRLDSIAVRVSRNGFQVMDLKARPPTSADGLFHRISFFNHCCAGLNNASWCWDAAEGLITVRVTRDVAAGEELTISYIAKPWCDLSKPARRRYLKQNFNFVCLCMACRQPVGVNRPSEADAGLCGRKEKSNDTGKLGDLLLRWMRDGSEETEPAEGVDVAEPSDRGATAHEDASLAKPASVSKAPLTDEERLQRVLDRCAGEGLSASGAEAEAALRAVDGHVGKAMIRLRRQLRAAGDDARTSAADLSGGGGAGRAEDEAGPTSHGVALDAYAVAAAVCLSVLAATLISRYLRKQ